MCFVCKPLTYCNPDRKLGLKNFYLRCVFNVTIRGDIGCVATLFILLEVCLTIQLLILPSKNHPIGLKLNIVYFLCN